MRGCFFHLLQALKRERLSALVSRAATFLRPQGGRTELS